MNNMNHVLGSNLRDFIGIGDGSLIWFSCIVSTNGACSGQGGTCPPPQNFAPKKISYI